MLTKRSIANVIVFSILTCGIYMVWWVYVTCTALQNEGRRISIPPVLTTVLMLFTSGIGGLLLGMDADDNINAIKFNRGLPQTDNKAAWMVLGFFLPIVTVGLVQYEINKLLDMGSYNPYGQNPYDRQPPYGQNNYPPQG